MKNLKIAIFAALFMTFALSAQVSVNVNLGTPPVWAPAERVETQYYFLPDIDTYYDVPSARFIYLKNGAWVRTASLPYRYRNYKLRGSNVVYLTDYRGNAPYSYHKNHKNKYSKKVFVNDDKNENKGYEKQNKEYQKENKRENKEYEKQGKGNKHKK